MRHIRNIQNVIKYYTREAGVRNLEREIAKICRKATTEIVKGNTKKAYVNNNNLKNFKQGLRTFSSSIPKTLKKHLKKGVYNYSNIVDNWTKLVTKEISNCCYPITIKMDQVYVIPVYQYYV